MTIDTIFRILTFILTVTALTISGYYRRKAEREAGALDQSEGQRLLIVLRLFGLLAILPLIGYWINPAWVAWARVDLPTWLRGLAAIIAACILPVFLAIFRAIGLNISPTQATREAHRLVTTGPYRFIRHPLYTAGFLFFLSLALVSGLWWLALGLAIGMIPLLARTPKEEALLLAAFGEEYADYQARTGRYWPKVRQVSHDS
jgi:protein-S-isoprenylcysteine O-methyltransferase Ste14